VRHVPISSYSLSSLPALLIFHSFGSDESPSLFFSSTAANTRSPSKIWGRPARVHHSRNYAIPRSSWSSPSSYHRLVPISGILSRAPVAQPSLLCPVYSRHGGPGIKNPDHKGLLVFTRPHTSLFWVVAALLAIALQSPFTLIPPATHHPSSSTLKSQTYWRSTFSRRCSRILNKIASPSSANSSLPPVFPREHSLDAHGLVGSFPASLTLHNHSTQDSTPTRPPRTESQNRARHNTAVKVTMVDVSLAIRNWIEQRPQTSPPPSTSPVSPGTPHPANNSLGKDFKSRCDSSEKWKNVRTKPGEAVNEGRRSSPFSVPRIRIWQLQQPPSYSSPGPHACRTNGGFYSHAHPRRRPTKLSTLWWQKSKSPTRPTIPVDTLPLTLGTVAVQGKASDISASLEGSLGANRGVDFSICTANPYDAWHSISKSPFPVNKAYEKSSKRVR